MKKQVFKIAATLLFISLILVGIIVHRCSTKLGSKEKIERQSNRMNKKVEKAKEQEKEKYNNKIARDKGAYEVLPDSIMAKETVNPQLRKPVKVAPVLTIIKSDTNLSKRKEIEAGTVITKVIKKGNLLYIDKITPKGLEVNQQVITIEQADFEATADSVRVDKKDISTKKKKKVVRVIVNVFVGIGSATVAVIVYIVSTR